MDLFDKALKAFNDNFEKYPIDRQVQTHASAASMCMKNLNDCIRKHGVKDLSLETIQGVIQLNAEFIEVADKLLEEARRRKLERMPCAGES